MLSSKNHPTVDQIYKMVLQKFPTISLAIVYQTVHLLKELGLLQELGFQTQV
jgi:Fur family peroxide stress response transcriptional regulator